MSIQLAPQVVELLQLTTMSLATCTVGGTPHSAPVYFAASQDLQLYFFSDPSSLHSQHLALNPQAAAAIYPECSDWQQIHGLQLHGRVFAVAAGEHWQLGWQVYAAKFPFATGLQALIRRNTLYCLQPGWLRLVDNRVRFGFKQEWDLA